MPSNLPLLSLQPQLQLQLPAKLVAMAILNSTKGSELIRLQTGRPCTRQNLEKLCNAGRLPASCVSLKPIRVESDSLVAEFLANVDVRQATAFNPGPSKAKAAQPRNAKVLEAQVNREVIERSFELPDYNESRARSEYEKANLLELERKTKEKLLLPADQVERVWANTVATVKTKLLAVPTRLRQRIPHLSLEEVAIADELIRESLIELSGEGDGDGQ